MPGLIKREDIDQLRAASDIKAIVEQHVTLKSAGIGSFKGLCPFHDERSPSFVVRPQLGHYHCFGCGEGGDVISFVQKVDHLSFTEAVEQLAARIGFELHYEDGGSGPRREDSSKRQRLLDAHKSAEEYFATNLSSPEAVAARRFLSERGFDRAAAEHFGVGYAPKGWDGLLRHLRTIGFDDHELTQTGMFSTGSDGRKLFDRFRGRLIWPIRTAAGETIGFGARKLYEDDQGPKYLNTPETALYKKSQVLYGLDLAKKNVSKHKQLVVVEGYTDVMACHLSGVDTAVATCGTAFGEEHVRVARRFLSDDGVGEVVFTFDGDAAGQNAALKAFALDQKFVAQTYVAVEPNGDDPCDVRLKRGDEAVKELIAGRRPLFEFAIRSAIAHCDLDTVEGRVQGLRVAAPILAQLRDPSTRVGYAQEVAGWLGIADPNDVLRAVAQAQRSARTQQARGNSPARAGSPNTTGQGGDSDQPRTAPQTFSPPNTSDPAVRIELQALEAIVQQPMLLSAEQWELVAKVEFAVPAYAAIRDAILSAGSPTGGAQQWLNQIAEATPQPLHSLLTQMVVVDLPAKNEAALRAYCKDMVSRLLELQLNREQSQRLGALRRMNAAEDPAKYRQLQSELMQLEVRRRALRQE